MQTAAMFLVGVLVLPVVVFLVCSAGMAFAATTERAQLRRIGFKAGARPFSLTLSEAFDPQHALVWSTQVPALLYIAACGAEGVAYRDLYRMAYEPPARHYPELYEGSSFAEWLFCLEKSELIRLTPGRVALTSKGRTFLEYCLTELLPAA
jgi:hypothetical protein